MKLIIISIVMTFTINSICAQGQLLGMTISPTNPTTSDSISFFVDVQFPFGGCQLSQSGISVNGTSCFASALHCLGMLTVICNRTDSFKIGPQSAGNYSFDMTLSSGSGSIPCTPGIAPDDNKVYQFTVTPATHLDQVEKSIPIRVYPNPAKDNAFFEFPSPPLQLTLYNSLGQLVLDKQLEDKIYRMNTQQLARGVYYYNSQTADGQYSGKLILD